MDTRIEEIRQALAENGYENGGYDPMGYRSRGPGKMEECVITDAAGMEFMKQLRREGERRAMNVKQIIELHLKRMGYDGLFNTAVDCACELADLAPCDGIVAKCEQGYKIPCDAETCIHGGGCEWHIGEKP